MVAFDTAGARNLAVAADLAVSTRKAGSDAAGLPLILQKLAHNASVVWICAVGHNGDQLLLHGTSEQK